MRAGGASNARIKCEIYVVMLLYKIGEFHWQQCKAGACNKPGRIDQRTLHCAVCCAAQ